MTAYLLVLAALAVVSMLLFFPLNTRVGRIRASAISDHIPFLPVFIVPYLALFPYVALSMMIVLSSGVIAVQLYISLIFCGLVGALLWYFFPVGASARPIFSPNGFLTKAVAWMYRHDPRCNAFPSSHTYTALLCSYHLTMAFPQWGTLLWGTGVLIISSTLFLKQHHVQDLVAGGALALVSISVSSYVVNGWPPF